MVFTIKSAFVSMFLTNNSRSRSFLRFAPPSTCQRSLWRCSSRIAYASYCWRKSGSKYKSLRKQSSRWLSFCLNYHALGPAAGTLTVLSDFEYYGQYDATLKSGLCFHGNGLCAQSFKSAQSRRSRNAWHWDEWTVACESSKRQP